MKTIVSLFLLMLAITPSFSRTNKSIKAVAVTDVSVASVFVYLTGYTVTFKNTSSKTIDQID
jgi:hypothetical protein